MLTPLTIAVIGLAVVGLVLSGLYAWRERLIDDLLLGILALLELALLVQVIATLINIGDLAAEKATFLAYALTLPFLPPAAAYLAIKEKSRWAMATIAVGTFAVAVMTARMEQIWSLHA